ncbi:MAG: DNA-binding protein, partial [Eubacterium sp.]|nr:DNA-binding protein [Eubacterium sp.]
FISFIIAMFFALKIEQTAGYYECNNCHYKYVPTYKSVFFAMHINRTRYMKCPKCKKRSWNKKVITK